MGKMPFEEFAAKMASNNIFDNDLLEQQYKFWESQEDREARLKLLWIDLKRKNALGGIDGVTSQEQQELNQEIVELVRRVRWRTDQELTRRNIEPVFKDFYTDKYDKEEFLIDAGFEFYKLKNLLSKNPRVLKDDPVLSLDYYKIIQLLRRKSVLENSYMPFTDENQVKQHWSDLKDIDKEQREKELREMRKYLQDRVLDGTMNDDVSQRMSLNEQSGASETVRNAKKRETRD